MTDNELRLTRSTSGAAELSGALLPIAIEAIGPELVRLSFGRDAAKAPSYLDARPPAAGKLTASETSLGTGALMLNLGVEPQQVVLGEAESADRRF